MKKIFYFFILSGVMTLSPLGECAPPNTGNKSPNAANPEEAHEFVMGLCRFKIKNMYGGSFSVQHEIDGYGGYHIPELNGSTPWAFAIYCKESNNQESLDEAVGAKLVDGKWIWLDAGEPFKNAQHLKIVSLNSPNWNGTGVTYDGITGDETSRERQFRFCLMHGPQALCGNTPVFNLNRPKDSNLKKIEMILQTIEFIDASTAKTSNN